MTSPTEGPRTAAEAALIRAHARCHGSTCTGTDDDAVCRPHADGAGWDRPDRMAAATPAPLDRLTDPAWLSDEMGMHQFVNDRQCDCGGWDAFHDKGTFNDHLANEIIAAARKPAATPPTEES